MHYFLGWNISLKCKFIHWLIDLFIVAMKLEFLKILRLVIVNSSVWWVCSRAPEKSCKALCIIQRLSCDSLLQSPSTSCNTTYNASFSSTSTTSTLKHAFQVIVFMLSLDKPLLTELILLLARLLNFRTNY